MRRNSRRILLALVLGALAARAVQTAPQSGYELFQQGLAKERAEGNLDEAIRIFGRAVTAAGADRALAARALLQIGDCDEKLGKPSANVTYERILREYADQPEAVVVARARLAVLSAAPAKQLTPGTPPEPTLNKASLWGGAISPDGRYVLSGNVARRAAGQVPSSICRSGIWRAESCDGSTGTPGACSDCLRARRSFRATPTGRRR